MVLQVDVHTVPASNDSEESISPSPTKVRRARQLIQAQQQQTNSPDIQSAPLVSTDTTAFLGLNVKVSFVRH